jgi:glycosyltransferase involved in cell wall biosynthesis
VWLAPSAFFPHKGGVEELTLQIAQALGTRGHDVLVVAPRNPDDLPAREVWEGVEVARVAFKSPRRSLPAMAHYPLQLVQQLRALDKLWRTNPPDLVHIQCPSLQTPLLTLMCTLKRVPLVVTSQGETKMDAHDVYGHSAFMRWSLRWAAKRAAALTACSTWTATAAAEIAPGFARADVILNGIDPGQWSVADLVDAPVVCAWGRHVPQKGLDLLIDAFKDVQKAIPDARLLIGGSGPETPNLERMAGPGVTFLGALDRGAVQAMLHSSRVAAVPSRLEPFGIVACEAMATGRPVVWSTIGGLGEATQGLGWGVDPNDRLALSGALVEALTAPDLDVHTFRAAAEERSWSQITDEYLAVYARCPT